MATPELKGINTHSEATEGLIDRYMGVFVSTRQKSTENEDLLPIQQEITQFLKNGEPDTIVLMHELIGRKKQAAQEAYDQQVTEYCMNGSMDPNLSDFYDNEVSASHQGLQTEISAIASIEAFLNQLQNPS